MKLDVNKIDDYDIACALRGPDDSTLYPLKMLLTYRVRARVGTAVNTHEAKASSNFDRCEEVSSMGQGPAFYHFLDHLRYAAESLEDYPLRNVVACLTHQQPIPSELRQEYLDTWPSQGGQKCKKSTHES